MPYVTDGFWNLSYIVPGVEISEAMRRSVLFDGQPKFSMKNGDGGLELPGAELLDREREAAEIIGESDGRLTLPSAELILPNGESADIISSGDITEGAGNYNNLLKLSTCSSADFYKYLNKINSDYADTYVKTGKWPSVIQIPKSPDVLKADGSIDWSKAPEGGYVLDSNGEAIKTLHIPGFGEIVDRNGPSNGRFTSPIKNKKPYSYTQRSLPYMENPSQYHRYKVTGDFSNIELYFNQSTDVNLKQMISAYMKKFRLSFSDLETYRGKMASGFGEIGGGEQYELPLPVDLLEGLGLLKEF